MRVVAGLTVREVSARTYRQFRDDDALTYAAALAFHGVLAFFPFLLVLVAVLSYLHVPGAFDAVTGWAERSLPSDGARQVEAVVGEIEQRHRGGLLSAGLLGAVWAASGGLRSAMRVPNQAYDVRQGRALWRRVALPVAYTGGLAAMVLAAGLLLFVGPGLAARLTDLVGLQPGVVSLWRWLRLPVAAALLLYVCSILYTALPQLGRFRAFTPGAVVAVSLWLVASWALQLYVIHVARLGATYGTVGALIVLLLYAWVAAIVFVLGAELNAVLDRHGPSGGRDGGEHA